MAWLPVAATAVGSLLGGRRGSERPGPQFDSWNYVNPMAMSLNQAQNPIGDYGNQIFNWGYNFPFQQQPQGNIFDAATNAYTAALPQSFVNYDYLNQFGLPGNQQLQGEQQQFGNVANQMLFGSGTEPWGTSQILNMIMQQGLPNQRAVESLAPTQLPFGIGNQAMSQLALGQAAQQGPSPASQRINQLIGGGGLTPDYVQSLQNLVFNPQREQFLGQLNRLSGGAARLDSPAYQELIRRNERDFTDQLIRASFENQNRLLGLGLQGSGQEFGQQLGLGQAYAGLGQQGIGNVLSAFGAVPQNVFPFMQEANQLGMGLNQQALQRFDVGAGRGLQNLSTLSDLYARPYQLGEQARQFNVSEGNRNQLAQMGMLLDWIRSQQQLPMQEADIWASLARSALAGSANLEGAEAARSANAAAARGQAVGAGTGGLVEAILRAYGNRGTRTPSGTEGTPQQG